jgi:hypothetical protein
MRLRQHVVLAPALNASFGSVLLRSAIRVRLLVERDQRNVSRSFDRPPEHSLVLRAGSGLTPRLDLAPVGDIATQPANILVVDHLDAIHAEVADLSAREVARSATAEASPSLRWTVTASGSATPVSTGIRAIPLPCSGFLFFSQFP